jgi:predicted phage tail protein
MNWKMSDLTNKDAEQDTKIAVMDSTLENSIRRIEMVHKRVDDTNEELEKLRDRIRTLEKWVAGAGAVIAAATFIIGIAVSVESKEIDYGRNGSTKSEELLQFPSNKHR